MAIKKGLSFSFYVGISYVLKQANTFGFIYRYGVVDQISLKINDAIFD
ncbi:hypothetical protein [Vibrio sp. OPT18]|nr:hypothetical protein [Vibrio sp. OPT18]MBE8574260.1 hypothetical protein [Vibrio sp. OPT18]